MKKIGASIAVLLIASSIACKSGSSGSEGTSVSDEYDRSNLPVNPEFIFSPYSYPGGVANDLASFGVYNVTGGCDSYHHVGWDFMPNWDGYPDDLVPIIAVADGHITGVNYGSNDFDGQTVNVFSIILAVGQNVDVHYTLEPFAVFDQSDIGGWVNVSEDTDVSAGDLIGYLPKIEGNIGEHLIHLDFKIGLGDFGSQTYVCPTDYFSSQWRSQNVDILEDKIQTACTSLCQ